jgi:hypothetical protein
MVRVWLAVIAALAAWGQDYDPKQPLTREMILLGRIQNVVKESLSHLPNFTCVETIERSQRPPNSKKYQFLDNVRLEVALVEGKEMYAWPGASKFEEKDLRDMVGGAIGTGDFALHAKTIYLAGTARFSYLGEEEVAGRKAHKFHYRVPIERSGYRMRIGTAEGWVGYQGHVWNDAETLEIARIEMTIDQIPSSIPLKEGRKTIEYAPMVIGGATYVLPVAVDMTLVGLTDGENRNRAVFTGCKQYAGESTLIFDEPAPEAKPKEEPVTVTLPEGLDVQMKLAATLDLAKGAMGDVVAFDVNKDAVKDGTVWLKKGARVELRLDQVACRDFPSAHCFVALAPGRFRDGLKHGVFRARLEVPDLMRSIEFTLKNVRPQLRMLPPEMGQASPGAEFLLVNGKRGKLSSGYGTRWRTLETRGDIQP